jgi:DNA repair photolyase
MESETRFRRLLISAPARKATYGQRVFEKFEREGLPAVEFDTDSDLFNHPDAARAGSVLVTLVPSMGWLTVAEHGALATRPGERYVNPIVGCNSACTYCYLRGQDVGLRPVRLHVGLESLLAALQADLDAAGPGVRRLYCTGELADSLADAELFPVGAILAGFFATKADATLELRTKSQNVDDLLAVKHNGKTTVSFSLAPQALIDRHEPGTASFEERVDAARRCQMAGYPIAFKLEPLLVSNGWKELYRDMLALIGARLDISAVQHVSVGCLRWSSRLAAVPTFAKQYRETIASGSWVNFRPGKQNGTVMFSERLDIYRWMRQTLRDNGLVAPIWWSLEEPDLLAALEPAPELVTHWTV